MVITLFVGMLVGAVYSPPLLMFPLVVPPLTLQFTRVLLKFKTLAVHWDVASTVTSVGEQETVIVGVAVVLAAAPQELRMAGTESSTRQKNRRSQRKRSHLKWKFDSNTRNPPARTPLIFLRKT
jgi:hypothetical protein